MVAPDPSEASGDDDRPAYTSSRRRGASRSVMDQIPRDARVFVAGHRGLVGSAVVQRLAAGRVHQPAHRLARPARSPRSGGGQLLVPGQPPRVRLPRRRHGRRDHGEREPSGRVHLRQPHDPRHGRAREPPVPRRAAPLPGQLVHLSPRGRAADGRERPPHRAARAHQRAVRDRQDRRHQALSGLPHPVRLRLHLGDAHQPLRPQRQLRPRLEPRAPGDDPQVPRGEARGRDRGRDLGDRVTRGASSSTSTTSPTRACS